MNISGEKMTNKIVKYLLTRKVVNDIFVTRKIVIMTMKYDIKQK